MGTEASILIHEVLVTMRIVEKKEKKKELDNITRTIHMHPALSEEID